MYPNISIIIFLSLFGVIGCKSSKKVSDNSTINFDSKHFLDSITKTQRSYKSLYIEKFNLRIDYEGQLRTHKSSIYFVTDSLLYLDLTASFTIPVATFYATQTEILIIDKPNKVIFRTNYDLLSKRLGFPINFSVLQSVLFGFSDQLKAFKETSPNSINVYATQKFINATYKQKQSNDTSVYAYQYNYSLPSKNLTFFDIIDELENRILESTYTYKYNTNVKIPYTVYIEFKYDSKPIGIELELKEPSVNQFYQFKIDSNFIFKPLPLDHE